MREPYRARARDPPLHVEPFRTNSRKDQKMETHYIAGTAYIPLLLSDPDYVDTLLAQVLEKALPLAETGSGEEFLLPIDVDGFWATERLAEVLVELPVAPGGVKILAQYHHADELHFETISPHPEDFEIAARTMATNCCCARIVLHPRLQCIKVLLS